ncbi:MAG: transcriptional activator NhaR [Planctomycetes bacterium]|nr:transcriptional activator NhaR [Planctomycetota bacterium]
MKSLDYGQLHTFWIVAKEGGVTKAAEKLFLAQPTISGQIRSLERAVGRSLVMRSGRGIALTEYGRHIYQYAEEIFSLGREMIDGLQGHPHARVPRVVVGIADIVPKSVSYRLLAPLLAEAEQVRVVCREGKSEDLLADLALHRLDLVISDAPVPPNSNIRAYSHLIGDSGVTLHGAARLARRYRRNFPKSLDGAPFLLPTDNTMLRRSLEEWFASEDLHPQVVGEFEDSALLKFFGREGTGIFASPTSVEEDVGRVFSVRVLGRIEAVRERFYAISVERRLRHPALVKLLEQSRHDLISSHDRDGSRRR